MARPTKVRTSEPLPDAVVTFLAPPSAGRLSGVFSPVPVAAERAGRCEQHQAEGRGGGPVDERGDSQ
jgi:hypothetical protein